MWKALALISAALCGGAVAHPQQQPRQTIEQQLYGTDPDVTVRALKNIAASTTLFGDPKIQRLVIRLLNRDSQDPDWGALAEMQQYDDYYSQLLETVKVIATQTHNRDAWTALATANYNARSQFGRWLGQRQEALPILIELTSYQRYPNVRNRMLEVLGYTVAACNTAPSNPACEPDTKARILGIIRKHAAEDPEVTPAAITTLGPCGTLEDIPLLESLRTKFRDPKDTTDARGWLVNQAEHSIRGRAPAK